MNKNASNFSPTQQFHMFLHIVKLSDIESSPIKNTSWTAKAEFMWIHGRFTKLTPSKKCWSPFVWHLWEKFRPLPQRFKQHVIQFFRGSPGHPPFQSFCGIFVAKTFWTGKNLWVLKSLRWDFWGFRTKEVKPKFIDVPLSGLQVEFEFGVRKNWWKNGGILKLRNLLDQKKRCMYTYFDRYNL